MLRLTLFGAFRAEDSQGNEIQIKSKKARALLAYLALPPGKPRSREGLASLLWSDRGDDQARGSLRQALSGLRRDLGNELAASLIVNEETVTLDPARVSVVSGQPDDELLEGLAVHDPAYEEWVRDERLRRHRAAAVVDAAREPTHTVKPTIAVLPFENLSADPEQQYFSDGITEEISVELGRFGSLDIVARRTGLELRDRGKDVRKALTDMGVKYLLEGSIRKAGSRIRLSARLTDAATQKQLWAERFERELTDIFAIQDELVQGIVTRLAGRVAVESVEQALRKPTERLDAYDYYLRGLWHDRRYDGDSVREAIEALEKAITLDPSFARAHGLLASVRMYMNWFSGALDTTPSDDILKLAKKAVELDPSDGDCFSRLAIIHLDRREHEQAKRNFETAFRLNPHDSYLWCHYAWYLVVVGEPEEALLYLDKVLNANPYPPNWYWDIRAEAQFGLDRYRDAIEALEHKVNRYTLNFGQAAACYGHLGEVDKARAIWNEVRRIAPAVAPSSIGNSMGYAKKADADRWTEGLKKAGIED